MRIGYARISTDAQSLNLQLDALKKAGCDVIYQDEGVSGAKAKRPGLDRALKKLKPGDHLFVWKLDRLGRSVRHLIELTSQFDAKGIAFTSLSDGIDTSTASGRLFFHITSAFAEFERNLISERTKAGMAAAKARGAKIGRPKTRQKKCKKKAASPQEKAIAEFESDLLDDEAGDYGLDAKLLHKKRGPIH